MRTIRNTFQRTKHYFILLAFLILGLQANALDTQKTLKEAGDLYSKGEFDKAIEKYKSILKEGYVSSGLYYNLGNAYFKSHNIKSAILNYEKAKLFDPSDKDIDYNLELAKTYTVDKIEAMPEVFLITWIKAVRNLLTANGWAIVSMVTFLLALSLLLLYLLSGSMVLKKLGFWCAALMMIIAVASFAMGFQLKQAQTANNTAIIFSPSVTVKSSPSDSGNNLFVLHEGSKVEIVDKVSEWCEIRIADGNRGWIKRTDLETI